MEHQGQAEARPLARALSADEVFILSLVTYVEEVDLTMRRKNPWMPLAGILAFVAIAVLLGAGVAGAGTANRFKNKSAALTGTSVWNLKTYTVSGTFDGNLGHGTYTGTLTGGADYTTPDCGPVCEEVTGTITFSVQNGDFTTQVQPGSVVVLEDIASRSSRDFTLKLSVTDGTRSYGHATGRLALVYRSLWTHSPEVIQDAGAITARPA